MTSWLRQLLAGVKVLLVATLVLGVAYPLLVLGIGRLMPARADGSLVRVGGTVVGSALIGQPSGGDQWFQPRPSAAGDGYDPLASGGSNLGPNDPGLLATVQQRREQVAAREGVDPAAVPADAVTASASGLDPDISPAYARLQVARVARARGLDPAVVRALVDAHVEGRTLGVLGDPHVDVLQLNVALAALPAAAAG